MDLEPSDQSNRQIITQLLLGYLKEGLILLGPTFLAWGAGIYLNSHHHSGGGWLMLFGLVYFFGYYIWHIWRDIRRPAKSDTHKYP